MVTGGKWAAGGNLVHKNEYDVQLGTHREARAVDGLATSAITTGEVATLDHELQVESRFGSNERPSVGEQIEVMGGLCLHCTWRFIQ